MYLSHIWMDCAWLGGVGFIASRQRFPGFALAMAYIGIMLIISSIL